MRRRRARYRDQVRWEALFGDLEAQLEADRAAGLAGEVAERTRAEWGALALVDRLQAQSGRQLTCWTSDGERLAGRLIRIGRDWLLIADPGGEHLLPLGSVVAVSGLTGSAEPTGQAPLPQRLPLTVVLRGLARDRAGVTVVLVGGSRLTGTVQRVGADHLDLALPAADDPVRGRAPLERISIACRSVVRITMQ